MGAGDRLRLELVHHAVARRAQLRDGPGNLVDVVRGHLVDPVKPVTIQQVGVGAPREERLLLGVVVREVVLGNLDGQALLEVARTRC